MKRISFRFVSLLTALAASAAFFAGCGGDAGSSAPAGDVSGTASSGAAASTSGGGAPIELTVFLNHTWYSTEEFTGIIPEEITKKTGVTLKPTRAIDYQQLGMMIASGELPDLVFTSQLLDKMSNPSISYSYNELISQYCPDWAVTDIQAQNAKAFSADENYYCVLSHFASNEDWQNTNSVPLVSSLTYRVDILEELGNPEINTVDDLLNVYQMVKDTYPDMIPLNFSTDTWTLEPFRVWAGCTLQNFVMNDDGTTTLTVRTEAFKDYLRLCNDMYRRGFFNADNFSWAGDEEKAQFNSGICFSTVQNTQNDPLSWSGLYEAVPDAHVLEMKPLSDQLIINSELGWCGTFITKGNKHPEESIRLMEFLFSEEGQKLSQWGREGTEYTLDDKGLPQFSDEWVASIADGTNTQKYNTNFYFGGSKILEAEGRCATMPDEYQPIYDAIRVSFRNDPWYIYAEPKEKDGDMKVIFDKLKDLRKNSEAKIILSEDDAVFEKNYAEFLSQVDKVGGDALEEFMAPRLTEAMQLYGAE